MVTMPTLSGNWIPVQTYIFKYLNSYCKLCNAYKYYCKLCNACIYILLYIFETHKRQKGSKECCLWLGKNAIYDLERMLFMIWILF